MSEDIKKKNNNEVAAVDPDVVKMIELIGGQKGKTLSTEAYAKSVILQNKTHYATSVGIANKIIAEVSAKQDKAIEVTEDSMRVTKACHDSLKKDIAKNNEAIKDLNRPLALWAWLVPILMAVFMGTIIFGVVMKMEALSCILLGIAIGLATFVVTFLLDQFSGHEKGGGDDD